MTYYKFKNNYELGKYDRYGNLIEMYNYDTTNEIKLKYRVAVANYRNTYIEKGHKVLDEKHYRMWDNFVHSTVRGDSAWEGASIVEAALTTMQMLSCGDEVEQAFFAVDVYSGDYAIYNDLSLSKASSNKASEIVILLHNRGEEFRNYRNQVIQEEQQKKVKSNNK